MTGEVYYIPTITDYLVRYSGMGLFLVLYYIWQEISNGHADTCHFSIPSWVNATALTQKMVFFWFDIRGHKVNWCKCDCIYTEKCLSQLKLEVLRSTGVIPTSLSENNIGIISNKVSNYSFWTQWSSSGISILMLSASESLD